MSADCPRSPARPGAPGSAPCEPLAAVACDHRRADRASYSSHRPRSCGCAGGDREMGESTVMSTPSSQPMERCPEDFFLHHISPIERLAVRLDKVNNHTAITRPQDTGRNFDHSREVGQDHKSLRHVLDRTPFETRGAPFP